jgi:hypothetical protein
VLGDGRWWHDPRPFALIGLMPGAGGGESVISSIH